MLAAQPTFVASLPEPEPLRDLAAGEALLFVQAARGSAWCLDAASGQSQWRLHAPAGGRIAALPDGETAIRFDLEGQVAIVDARSGRARPASPLPGQVADVERVTVAPDGRRVFVQAGVMVPETHLIYGDFEERMDAGFLWDVDRELTMWEEQEPRYDAVPPRFSRDGRRLLLPPGLHRPMAWLDARTGRTRRNLACARWLPAMCVSAEGDFAVHTHEGALARTPLDAEALPAPTLVFGHGWAPLAIAPDDGAVVAVAGPRLAAFELHHGRLVGAEVTLPPGFVPACAAFAADGRALFVGAVDGRVARYEADPGAAGRAALAPAIAHDDPGLSPALGGEFAARSPAPVDRGSPG